MRGALSRGGNSRPRVEASTSHSRPRSQSPTKSAIPAGGTIIEKLRTRVLNQHLMDHAGKVQPVQLDELTEEAQEFVVAAIQSMLNRKVAITNGELSAIGRLLQQHYPIQRLTKAPNTKPNSNAHHRRQRRDDDSASNFCPSVVSHTSSRSGCSAVSTASSAYPSSSTNSRKRRELNAAVTSKESPTVGIGMVGEHLTPVDAEAQERFLSSGVIKPHMIKRLQLLHADMPFRQAMEAEASKATSEEHAAIIEHQKKYSAVAEVMRELDDRRRNRIEERRREREAGKVAIKREIAEIHAEEIQRQLQKKKGHDLAKAMLFEQQRLRNDAIARQKQDERELERQLLHFMKEAETEEKYRDRVKAAIVKEEVQEYVAFCNKQLKEREERAKKEKEEERRMDQRAIQLALEQERKRFGTSKTDKAGSVADALATLGISPSQHAPSGGGIDDGEGEGGDFATPLHIFATRDRDRSPKVLRKMFALREAQDVAGKKYQELKKLEEGRRLAYDKQVMDQVRRREEEKEERNRQDHVKKLADRAKLLKDLSAEVELHKRRDEDLQKEKETYRKMADDEASKYVKDREFAVVSKLQKRHQFVSEIDRQREGDCRRKLLVPIPAKIGDLNLPPPSGPASPSL